MALQLGARRATLIDAGARSEAADAAAEEAAGHQLQFDARQSKVDAGFGDIRAESIRLRAEMAAGFTAAAIDWAEMRASIRILQWGQAFILAGIISLVAKAFFHAG